MHNSITRHAEARRGLLLVMLAAVLWGTVGVSSKTLYAISATTPLSIGFFRLALAVPVLLLACWFKLGRGMLRVTRRDFALMVLIGAMTALYQACYFAAIARVGVAVATLITLCTAPVMVALLATLFTAERLTGRLLLALALALAGTAMLVGIGPGGPGPKSGVTGHLLALGSAFGYAVVALATRMLAGRHHPFQPIAISFSIGALLLFLCNLPQGLVVRYPAEGWGLLVYLGVVPTALAYVAFIAGMRSVTATTASICTLLEPLTSTLLAWLIFGERLGSWGIFGALLLAGAMGMLFTGGRRIRDA
ncbi:EamA family transporter [Geobacter sp. FeAm09]|uniref:DMT family transporter n=1 Tax=Geobacter sp. FeAm09 TaxID=2597769 RepID=UPI0011EE6657|nr:EamA family transporter [Geobacter sp. FeAm09]QEM69287.1 EamA family transporter [Geobacter sp. FeAm09]